MKRVVVVFLLLYGSSGFAQILDDTTKLVYGPTTTQYLYEYNIKYNDRYFVPVDTSVFNLHRFTTTEVSNYLIQDLGVVGTANRNLYYTPPTIIGARSGFTAYETFFVPPEEFRYYDTKSPYSRIGAAIGGNGRSRVDVGFNRSDSSNFNIGLDYNRIVSDKQTASLGRNDRLVDSEGYDIYMLYHTPNNKYLILGNWSRNKSTAIDQGGIKVDSTGVVSPFDENASVNLANAKSEFLKRNLHFYHHFLPDSGIQFYQNFDRTFESSQFRNSDLASEDDYFGQYNFSTDTTGEENIFITNTLETGVKGSLGKLFYLGYYKLRSFDFQYQWAESDTANFRTLKPETEGLEHYLGGMVRIQLNRNYKLSGTIDFNLNGNQRITGNLLAKNFDVRVLLQQHSPSFMERAFLGNHDFWVNDFKNIKVTEVEGGYLQPLGRSFLRAKGRFATVSDYVYYGANGIPQQTNGTTTIITPGLEFSINFFSNFYIRGNFDYNLISGTNTEAMPVPQIVTNVNFFYHNLFFNDNLEMQAGLDNHWKSAYFAPDYRVSTNQFFVQNETNIDSYLITDFYLNIKLDHAFLFAKVNNLLGLLDEGVGYYVAPNYIGKRTLFDFGFYWMFYD